MGAGHNPCLLRLPHRLVYAHGDDFHLTLNDKELGDVSFREHSVVEIDLLSLAQANEEGFEYVETLSEVNFYKDVDDSHIEHHLRLGYNGTGLSGSYTFMIPDNYTRLDLRMDKEGADTLAFRLDTDGTFTGASLHWGVFVFYVANALKDNYHIKFDSFEADLIRGTNPLDVVFGETEDYINK